MRRPLLAVALVAVLAGCAHPGPTPRSAPTGGPSGDTLTATLPAGSCHTGPGGRPDPVCTPGVTNPAVTQATIGQTICVKGWTATVRPPQSFTGPLKVAQIRAYGYGDTNVGDYEEDHLLPLELGGAPSDVRNLWPQPRTQSGAKDADENAGKAAVCSGQMTLDAAQAALLAKWGPSPSPSPSRGH